MTVSQQKTYDHICSHALSTVWGPPGSGKTHFLTAAICRMLVSLMAGDYPMRVLVTAFTNNALDLLLGRVHPAARSPLKR